jgi:hypothetical protein
MENVHNSAAETLGSAQEKSYDSVAATDFYHPGMMDKLGNIAEVMGWHRVPAEQEWDLSKLSPYNIIIGNAMYEWHQTPGRDLYSNRAGNSVAIDPAHNVGKNVGAARDYATQVASGASENVRDVAAHVKNKLWDSQQESQTGDSSYWDIAKNSAAAAAAGSVGEKLGSAGEYANDKVNAASNSIKSTTTRTKENLQDSQIIDSGSKDGYFQDTTDSVNNAASKMREKLESAGSQAAETVGGVTESMKESLWDKQPNLTDRAVSGFAHNGKERVNEASRSSSQPLPLLRSFFSPHFCCNCGFAFSSRNLNIFSALLNQVFNQRLERNYFITSDQKVPFRHQTSHASCTSSPLPPLMDLQSG